MDDAELIQSIQDGDRGAYVELVKRYTPLVYRVALRLSGNPSDAEEILQETFVQLHRKLDSFRGESKLSTWLYRVAVNAARMHHRARRGRDKVERPLEDYLPRFDESGILEATPRADELLERHQLAQAALGAVAGLPELYRVPFVLRDLEGLDTAETAALLDLDVGLVRQRVHRARLMLRAQLDKLAGGGA